MTDEERNNRLVELEWSSMSYDEMARRVVELEELVLDLMGFFEDDDACEHCGHDVECAEANGLTVAYDDDCLMRDVFKRRMTDLEVVK